MNWTFYLVLSFWCLVVCDGWHDYSECDCNGNGTEKHCTCDQHEGGYKKRVCLIVIASLLAVGVVGIIVGCCVYNRKRKKEKTDQDKFEEPKQYVKDPLPDWDSLATISFPPKYTTLPFYHPETHNSSISPPPPYSKY
ncbi:uncharacterized protein LOC123524611 [Mercenaria mercenaria]|uniref:uncharacterized protein LOC123524611 n=1 Tax=Mercenaria mercenaria TaxID=6596 RepID=UPI00234EC482|nr:uncharacterized protein LOC123524611 [Mercenaria mercenaria]